MRARLPPAAPTTQLSIARMHVGRPITRSVRSTGRPPFTTETFELVPPHSITIASRTASWWSAAATPAAGPEPTVSDGRPPELGDAHRAAVAAQHEQRHAQVGARERVLDVRRRPLDDREDARVDRRAHGPRLEPVGPGELVPGADGQPAGACTLRDGLLERRIVHGERAADRDRGTARAREPLERGIEVAVQPRRLERFVLGLERASCRESDRSDPRALAGAAEVGCTGEPDHADAGDVALEQRVHRLGRRERDELDACPLVAELHEQVVERVCDSGGDAFRSVVRRRQRRARAQLECRRIHRDGLRERPADVDPDAQPAVHALAASSARRRSGSHANM